MDATLPHERLFTSLVRSKYGDRRRQGQRNDFRATTDSGGGKRFVVLAAGKQYNFVIAVTE